MVSENGEQKPAPSSEQPILGRLNQRERQVLKLIYEGRTLKEIAVKMGIRQQTVSTYKQRIFWKLHLTNNYQLTLLGVKSGLIDLQSAEKHLAMLNQLQAA